MGILKVDGIPAISTGFRTRNNFLMQINDGIIAKIIFSILINNV